MNKRIYLSPPHMTGEEMLYIQDAISSNWVAPVGPHLDAFESEIAGVLGVNDAVAVNSGTSAIHLALLVTGVKPGDEVICPTLTFCATANPIVYCGAIPVFVDSEPETWNIDPVLMEEAIVDRIGKTGKKPAAIIVVHLYGMPANMDDILSIAEKYKIPVVEDAAEALGSSYNGKPMGTLGAAGIISFNGNKIITTSGGGALVCKNSAWNERARFLRQEAKQPLPYYEHHELGYNYRMSNISAAIGRAQLKSLKMRLEKKRSIFDYYAGALKPVGIGFQTEPLGHFSNRWLSVIRFAGDQTDMKENVRIALEKKNIESRLAWKPMHLQPFFRDAPVYGGKISEQLFQEGLCLPSGSALTEPELATIVGIIRNSCS